MNTPRDSRATVLLVDPFDDSREMYAQQLRASGFDLIATDNGDDALPKTATADVIVTGIRIRGSIDGLEFARRVRRQAAEKPIVVLTACAEERWRQATRDVGCHAFLTKPCLPAVLVDEIARALANASCRQRHRE